LAMTYSSLTAPKNTSGSVATWVAYTKLDLPPIVDEAQALLYSSLRTREMMTQFDFNIPIGGSFIALPPRFLEGIGRMYCPSVNLSVRHKDSEFVQRNRNYTETSGTLGNNPITTGAIGSSLLTINLPQHGFSQESSINLSGATTVDGVNPNGTFGIETIVDVNNFIVDTITGSATVGGVTGGGASVAYLVDNLVQAFANWWAIWDEEIHFDCAGNQSLNYQLQYYQSLPLLSSTNQSNFLTNRYPQLMRTACVAAAADFMKDDNEYQKGMQRLQQMIMQISVENDMQYRGMELDTETP
jgi:hypothetical protein